MLEVSPSGHALVRFYYRHSAELLQLLAREPEIRKRLIFLSEKIDRFLELSPSPGLKFAGDICLLFEEVLAKGSQDLRTDAQLLLGQFPHGTHVFQK